MPQKRNIALLHPQSLWQRCWKVWWGPSSTGCLWQWRCTVCQAATRVLLVLVRPTPAAVTDKSFWGYLFGVTRRKLFPVLGFSHRVPGCPSSPLWGLRSFSTTGSLWSPACRLCLEHALHILGSKPYTATCIQVQTLILYFSALLILSLCLLLIYSSRFHFSLFSFALNILTHWVLLHWTKLFI